MLLTSYRSPRYGKTEKNDVFLLCHQYLIELFIILDSALHALSIIPQEHVCFIEIMDSLRILAWQALAELFNALKPQKAHWYSIKATATQDPLSDRIEHLFPPLGTLLSLTAEIMNFVLEASGLMRWKDKNSPCLKSWGEFQAWIQVTNWIDFSNLKQTIKLH